MSNIKEDIIIKEFRKPIFEAKYPFNPFVAWKVRSSTQFTSFFTKANPFNVFTNNDVIIERRIAPLNILQSNSFLLFLFLINDMALESRFKLRQLFSI